MAGAYEALIQDWIDVTRGWDRLASRARGVHRRAASDVVVAGQRSARRARAAASRSDAELVTSSRFATARSSSCASYCDQRARPSKPPGCGSSSEVPLWTRSA